MAYESVEIAQLRTQREALDRQLAEAKERETQHVLQEIVQKMHEYGITPDELLGRKPSAQPARSSAKYRDPVTGSTWSGRGRAPAWIAGKDRNEFLVDKRSAAPSMVQAALFPEHH